MTDQLREGLNSQKRSVCVGVYKITADALSDNEAKVAYLPQRSLITSVRAVVKTASGNAGGNVKVKVGGIAVTGDMTVGAVTTVTGTLTASQQYQATGGLVSVVPGGTAPTGTDYEFEIVMEYIELDKTTGEYTRIG